MTSPGSTPVDERVASATAHWAPRFIANGTDYPDFVATLSRIATWDQWCREWGATAAHYEDLAREAESRGDGETAAGAWCRAGLSWHWGKFVFVDDMQEQQAAHKRAVSAYARGVSGLKPPAVRVEIPYADTVLPAYLRTPGGSGPHPTVLMAPGLDSTKEELQATATFLLARGLATVAIDGPGQGESEYSLPIEPAYEKVATAAVDWLLTRDDVDPQRIGFFGVSLGGYYAGRAAAYEPRLRATVALCGAYSFDWDWDDLPDLTRAAFQQRSGASTPDEARAKAATLTLQDAAPLATRPLLVVHGARDRLLPAHHAERLAAEAPGAQLLMYPDGNHGVTNHPYESRSYMADWLAAQLKG